MRPRGGDDDDGSVGNGLAVGGEETVGGRSSGAKTLHVAYGGDSHLRRRRSTQRVVIDREPITSSMVITRGHFSELAQFRRHLY